MNSDISAISFCLSLFFKLSCLISKWCKYSTVFSLIYFKALQLKITYCEMHSQSQDQELHSWLNLVKASLNIAQVAQ
jgi:hypothetical protein